MTEEKTKTTQRPTPAILRTLQEASRVRAESLRASSSVESLLNEGLSFPKRSLADALTSHPPAIIAEVKKASPSKGVFRNDFDPVALATAYNSGGAAAISVVTEPDHFQGRSEWIKTIRETCDLPILRKDFIVDEIQVADSSAIGADAILLIARILTDDEIARFSATAAEANLEVLYEAHDADDLTRILAVNPRLVGVNARNLDNFVVDTGSFASLLPLIPSEVVAVAESGLENAIQIQLLKQIGYRGFLIGETLIRAENPAKLIGELRKPE